MLADWKFIHKILLPDRVTATHEITCQKLDDIVTI